VRREWEPEKLIGAWTLVEADWELLANKTGPTRLGFALLLKFFELEGRFPRHAGEAPKAAVAYLAAQLKLEAKRFTDYEWTGRTIRYHRAQIRGVLGFREATVRDEDELANWLAKEICPLELSADRRREALVARCRAERIEPPASGRIERILGSVQESFDQHFTAHTVDRLSEQAIAHLEALATADGAGLLADLKSDPSRLGLPSLLRELDKLERVRALGLPPELFADVSDRVVAVAGSCLSLLPVGPASHPGPGATHPPGSAVLVPHRRGHRQPR
jgi:hypothetical protein